MASLSIEPLLHQNLRQIPKFNTSPSFFSYRHNKFRINGERFRSFKSRRCYDGLKLQANATSRSSSNASSSAAAIVESFKSSGDDVFQETFSLNRTKTVEGKIFIRLDRGRDEEDSHVRIGCTLPGKWILHWGVSYIDDIGSEWDQPPAEMRPPGSVPIKDYAIETPLQKSSTTLEGNEFYEVVISFKSNNEVAAVNFVLKVLIGNTAAMCFLKILMKLIKSLDLSFFKQDEESGAWYQHRARDFKVPLLDCLQNDGNIVGSNRGFGLWPGALGQLSNMLLKAETAKLSSQDTSSGLIQSKQAEGCLEDFYEELPISKEVPVLNSVSVYVRNCPQTARNLVYLETDLSGDVLVHWGVCRDDAKKWEIPDGPYPPETIVFKNKALRTFLQPKEHSDGGQGLFTLDDEFMGFLFVLKVEGSTYLNCEGNDFYIPLSPSSSLVKPKKDPSEEKYPFEKTLEVDKDASSSAYTDEIINEIRSLVSEISSEKSHKAKTKEAQESILQEIEKLAAEAYSIFRSSMQTFSEETVMDPKELKPPAKICSGTGTGYEILCQGFNWESHKSGRWYMQLKEIASELSSLGFTIIWLPPPTDSVSPEGYMPRDLYNLNSRYGTIYELKDVVKTFHGVNIKVLGDVVLNHRCAQYKNQNGIWNIFGGRLNWDERAVVCDDPHFQGRGNKSSGDNFHAAPNIDHSQDFVRKDIKEWLHWLRDEIGYDGWRLDFVRGFWGGYVKDYLDATEPYFAVGEYWDSLSYTYGEMDHNQDAHRQRIIDWINATSGTAGAFDVTTKGILHSALQRCEYWRLSDQKGKPPGVVGWWPSRAVTFIENHDTGSTQGHWRFPEGKEMQGYAYILTHPGTPAVFYDHIFSHYKSEIASLISLRNCNKIHCRSMVQITKAERDVYAAIIDEKVAMKIGPGHYEPPSGPQRWSVAIEGRDYKVWETVP